MMFKVEIMFSYIFDEYKEVHKCEITIRKLAMKLVIAKRLVSQVDNVISERWFHEETKTRREGVFVSSLQSESKDPALDNLLWKMDAIELVWMAVSNTKGENMDRRDFLIICANALRNQWQLIQSHYEQKILNSIYLCQGAMYNMEKEIVSVVDHR
jgi:hypothetical protein